MSDQQQQQQQTKVNPSMADLDKKPDLADTNPPDDSKSDDQPADDQQQQQTDNAEGNQPDDNTDADNTDTDSADQDNITTPEEFWGSVSKLRGDDLRFEFPAEITDPLTPEAVHHAIRLSEDRAIDRWEEDLQRRDARAYSYMLHRARGGDDDTFFADKTQVLPDLETLKGSVDLQQAFYKRSLTSKGILPEQADLIIKDAIDKQKLFGLVQTEHQNQDQLQKDQLEELKRITEQNQQRETQLINKLGTTLQERILQNKNMPITIPDAKRAEFLQFVNNLVVLNRETGKFSIEYELNNDNLSDVLSALYYMKVKGNLADIIVNKANQQNVQSLKLRMQKDKVKKSSAPDPNKQKNDKPGIRTPLSDL